MSLDPIPHPNHFHWPPLIKSSRAFPFGFSSLSKSGHKKYINITFIQLIASYFFCRQTRHQFTLPKVLPALLAIFSDFPRRCSTDRHLSALAWTSHWCSSSNSYQSACLVQWAACLPMELAWNAHGERTRKRKECRRCASHAQKEHTLWWPDHSQKLRV